MQFPRNVLKMTSKATCSSKENAGYTYTVQQGLAGQESNQM